MMIICYFKLKKSMLVNLSCIDCFLKRLEYMEYNVSKRKMKSHCLGLRCYATCVTRMLRALHIPTAGRRFGLAWLSLAGPRVARDVFFQRNTHPRAFSRSLWALARPSDSADRYVCTGKGFYLFTIMCSQPSHTHA
jgi:hypothetical protein